MIMMRTLLTSSVLLLATLTSSLAAPPVKTLKELQALQHKVSSVAQKVQPATVSLFSAKNGASGSGVIVNRDGLILTAAHVVRGAEEMNVIFPDGTEARGKVLGANYTRDAAMIQITGKGPWPYAPIGHSKNLKSGDFVVALGHAGGFDAVRTPPVRFGRVLATGSGGFINTDCTLIGGDSGGPLFDLEGRVIAIHSSIGLSLNINNHTGIDGFRRDWERLKRGESWGKLGASTLEDPDNPVIGIYTGRTIGGGVIVTDVVPNGPAHKAGLQRGDIIRSIAGEYIRNQRRLNAVIFQFKPGDSVKVEILRQRKTLTRKVVLGRRGELNR